MEKKTFNYILIAILAVALALFVGLFLGNNKNSDEVSSTYTPPSIEDSRGDSVYDPNLGTVEDNDNYINAENYYLKANNSATENLDYFINYNSLNANSETVYDPYLIGMFNSTYASDLSSSSFITVERLLGNSEHSSLVYIKFSTFLGKYDSENLLSVTPALVLFGFEQTVNNEFNLKYAFCTYGDRGEVYSDVIFLTASNDIGNSFKIRVPYLLSSNYEEVTQLFTINGLSKDGYTYKLLNNESDQYYIASNVITIVSNLTKNLIGHHISIEPGKGVINNIDLTDYFVLKDIDCDNILADYLFINSFVLRESTTFDYFNDNSDLGITYYSLHHWFNNEDSIYNIPLINIEV